MNVVAGELNETSSSIELETSTEVDEISFVSDFVYCHFTFNPCRPIIR